MAQSRQFVALQAVSRSVEKEIPRRLRGMMAVACPGDYEDPDRTAWNAPGDDSPGLLA
jgi:hypothetical protein